jgi:hypothetical protein
MLRDDTPDSSNLRRRKPDAVLDTNGIQPDLGQRIVPLYVRVPRFTAIARVEEKTVPPDSQCSWHRPSSMWRCTSLL